jgi:DNA-binding XRE family transcriptional regulator
MYEVEFYRDKNGESEIVEYLDELKGTVNDMADGKIINTITDYMSDETRVNPAERERINFEVALIGKMIEAREEKGLSQRELAEISGVKQPAIARLESMKATPQID